MALTQDQAKELTLLVHDRLDEAEGIWNKLGRRVMVYDALAEALTKKAEVVPSKIPGHTAVSDHDPQVDTFIALVADMRDSSQHLMCAMSSKIAKVSELQRVFYETSALLPALARTVRFEQGQETEYLGDGVLALFQVDEKEPSKALKAAYRAAKHCIDETRGIVNKALHDRYSLPPLDIGVGLSNSRAMVTLVGLDGDKHPKAIGRCVYVASKLSGERNKVVVDEWLRETWPSSDNGILTFRMKQFGDVQGYLVARSTT